MKNTEWIAVDRKHFEEQAVEDKNSAGVHLKVLVSPYNIPDAINGCYDPSRQRLVIEFKYPLNEERKRDHALNEHVKLLVGRHSKRIYEIEIDVDALGVGGVGLDLIPQALESAGLSSDNTRIASNLITSNRETLRSRASTPLHYSGSPVL